MRVRKRNCETERDGNGKFKREGKKIKNIKINERTNTNLYPVFLFHRNLVRTALSESGSGVGRKLFGLLTSILIGVIVHVHHSFFLITPSTSASSLSSSTFREIIVPIESGWIEVFLLIVLV
jgi:hypothetical protein